MHSHAGAREREETFLQALCIFSRSHSQARKCIPHGFPYKNNGDKKVYNREPGKVTKKTVVGCRLTVHCYIVPVIFQAATYQTVWRENQYDAT